MSEKKIRRYWHIDGVRYESMAQARLSTGLSLDVIRKWCTGRVRRRIGNGEFEIITVPLRDGCRIENINWGGSAISIGDKFGKWTAKKLIPRKTGARDKTLWECQCDCGNIKNVIHGALLAGKSSNCGCVNRDLLKSNNYKGLSAAYWRQVKKGAAGRDCVFAISMKMAWDAYVEQDGKCALTGVPIEIVDSYKSRQECKGTASLDRIDSELGYIPGNIQWLHKTVNVCKWAMSQHDFIDMCSMVHFHSGSKDTYKVTTLPENVRGANAKKSKAILHMAIRFATEAHSGQSRKYSGLPYIIHPVEVCEIVRSVTDDEEILAAALLHDVVEDTPITIDMIEIKFGKRIADLVGWLTDVSRPEDGNRATRKQMDLEHTAAAPADAQTIKLADLIDNTRSITRNDPDFARVYMKEKERLLAVLTKGDPALLAEAHALLTEYQNGLLQEALRHG